MWCVNEPEKIPPAVRDLIDAAGRVFVSLISLWEIVVKESTPRPIVGTRDAQGWFNEAMADAGHHLLAIRTRHVGAIQALPLHHGDPFDRLLVAQAIVEDMPIVTADSLLDRYDVEVIWAS